MSLAWVRVRSRTTRTPARAFQGVGARSGDRDPGCISYGLYQLHTRTRASTTFRMRWPSLADYAAGAPSGRDRSVRAAGTYLGELARGQFLTRGRNKPVAERASPNVLLGATDEADRISGETGGVRQHRGTQSLDRDSAPRRLPSQRACVLVTSSANCSALNADRMLAPAARGRRVSNGTLHIRARCPCSRSSAAGISHSRLARPQLQRCRDHRHGPDGRSRKCDNHDRNLRIPGGGGL
jgi:hypothetical protein